MSHILLVYEINWWWTVSKYIFLIIGLKQKQTLIPTKNMKGYAKPSVSFLEQNLQQSLSPGARTFDRSGLEPENL